MKSLIALLLLLSLPLTKTENPLILEWKHFTSNPDLTVNWQEHEGDVSFSSRLNFYQFVVASKPHRFCTDAETLTPETLHQKFAQNFHFLDFDKDGDVDVIFEGKECSGFESNSTILYVNLGDNTYQDHFFPGHVLNFSREKGLLSIYNPPCCATPYSRIHLVNFQTNPIESEFIQWIDNSIYIPKKPEFNSENFKDTLVELSPKDTLYAVPSLVYKGMISNKTGNAFALSRHSRSTKSLYQMQDSLNNTWQLCVFKVNQLHPLWEELNFTASTNNLHLAWIYKRSTEQ